jgi:stress response protein SCP2
MSSSSTSIPSDPKSGACPSQRVAGRIDGVQNLAKGANAALPPGPVAVRVTAAAPVDISALLVTAAGTVRGDADFVFYNQPTAPGVRHDPAGVDVEPGAVDTAIERVVVTASLDGSGPSTFGALGDLRMDVTVAGQPFARFVPDGLGQETALLCVELYRRAGAWKVRAVGQGYANGLAGIATDFGITVEEPQAVAPSQEGHPAATGSQEGHPAATPGARAAAPSKINLDKGKVSWAWAGTPPVAAATSTSTPP